MASYLVIGGKHNSLHHNCTHTVADPFAARTGEGFLGHNMVLALIARYPGAPVASLDIVQRHFPSKSSHWTFHSADLTSLPDLAAAIKASGATTVFHTASPWTGSGADVCEKVNVVGTQTVVDACVQEGVKHLVFTSSAGTVYNGRDLINVDERMPFPTEGLDPYNVTKAKAETIVLEANGKGGLLTVALRPAGIFGPGDRQALPGFIDVLKSGKAGFQIGSNTNLFDWTYVDNVVHAHLVAAERLEEKVPFSSLDTRISGVDADLPRRKLPTSEFRPESLLEKEKSLNPEFINNTTPDAPLLAARTRYDQFYPGAAHPEEYAVAGQAFFITNGEPIGFWDFGRAIWAEYNGYVPKFTVKLPVDVGLAIASVGETATWALGRPPPNLTRGKVMYSTVHRYYNIEKARRVLGYEPIVGLQEGIKRGVAWYKENEASVAAAGKAVKA
ncbi:C-3 sterol dehydrogenase [Pseudohyphozyma bogoriensis]|nr:C-3 sterol dehydrogenase [Pseudohyphozyma bogoriensis]